MDALPAQIREPLEAVNDDNNNGEICWVIGITGAGAEGISLKCCRTVHIMEPYWNNVRLEQVKGRAIRICSHKDLPYDEREVEIFTYYTVFSQDQLRNNKIAQTITNSDGKVTSDENVYQVSVKKDKINNAFLKLMKEAAVDCNLNQADNNDVACLNITGSMNTYLFDPNLEVDKVTTAILFKEEKKEEKREVKQQQKEAPKVKIGKLTIKGTSYMVSIRPGSGGTIYDIYPDDPKKDYLTLIGLQQVAPIGEITINPIHRYSENPFKGSTKHFF